MPTYQYVNNSGGMSTINANTANEALANAQDKEPSSGVGLISTPQGASTTPTPPQSGVITPASLQNNQTPIQVPQPNPSVPPTPSTQPTLAQNLLGSFDLTANEQAATNTQENLVAKMLDNINNLAGESAFRTQVTNESGLGQKKLELQNLNSQILQKQAEIQQSDIQLVANMRAEERRDTLLPFAQAGQAKLAGDAAITRALKTSEIGVLNALALGKQGDIQLAKESINEAVDAKFAPYKEQNAVYEAQLKAIQPFLDKAEKKEAAKMQVKVSLAMKEIDKVSDFQKQILNNAISRNAPQSVLNAINRGQSIEEITKAGAGYLKSEADLLDGELKRLSIQNARMANQEGGKLSADEKKTQKATKTLVGLLDTYEKEITGINFLEANSPAKRTALNSLKGRITAEYKQAKQLGTLDTGVQKLIDQIIPNPGNLSISSLNNAAQIKAIQDFKRDFTGETDPTEAYYNASTSAVTSSGGISGATSNFIQEYNNRSKVKK
jgi:glutaredoxin